MFWSGSVCQVYSWVFSSQVDVAWLRADEKRTDLKPAYAVKDEDTGQGTSPNKLPQIQVECETDQKTLARYINKISSNIILNYLK